MIVGNEHSFPSWDGRAKAKDDKKVEWEEKFLEPDLGYGEEEDSSAHVHHTHLPCLYENDEPTGCFLTFLQ